MGISESKPTCTCNQDVGQSLREISKVAKIKKEEKDLSDKQKYDNRIQASAETLFDEICKFIDDGKLAKIAEKSQGATKFEYKNFVYYTYSGQDKDLYLTCIRLTHNHKTYKGVKIKFDHVSTYYGKHCMMYLKWD